MMFKCLIFIALLALGFGESVYLRPRFNPKSPNGRIVGGEATTIQEVPYQVALQVSGFSYCGATIISKDWVLTAAHCASYSVNYITVRAGTTVKGQGGSLHSVSEIIQHEKYSTNSYGIPINDVAVLKLATPLELDETRQPVLLFGIMEEAVEGIHTTITGWGASKEGGSTTEELNIVNVPVVHKEDCNNAYSNFGGIPDGQICAAYPEGGKDACQGDSGGPLTILGRLAGIVSWGNGCARPGYPGVYTEVAAYRQWIQDKTNV